MPKVKSKRYHKHPSYPYRHPKSRNTDSPQHHESEIGRAKSSGKLLKKKGKPM